MSKDELLLSTLYNRHAAALSVVAQDGNQRVHIDAARMSLALMARELADIHQANGGDKRVDLRSYEWLNEQIARLNNWLAEHFPGLYQGPGTDTATAMIIAANQMQADFNLALDRERLLVAERDALRQQLAQLDADNAALIAERDKLSRHSDRPQP